MLIKEPALWSAQFSFLSQLDGSDPLPRIRLRISGSRVQAIGIDGLIFGRRTNVA